MKVLKNNSKLLYSNGKPIKYDFKIDPSNKLQRFIDGRGVSALLEGCYDIEDVSFLDGISLKNHNNIDDIFHNCKNITKIPILKDTENITSMSSAFYNCQNLRSVKLDIPNCSYFRSAFQYCYNLITIDLLNLSSTSSNDLYNIFYYCHSLKKLIIRNINNTILNSNSFYRCYHLTGERNSRYNPRGLRDGRIYVPDNMVDQLKSATNWSTYADIIVPLSTLEE